jgi:hypothetical protein
MSNDLYRGVGRFSKINNITVGFCCGEAIKTIKAKPEHFFNNNCITKVIY